MTTGKSVRWDFRVLNSLDKFKKMSKQHNYTLTVKWTGNKGTGTSHAAEYERSHTLSAAGKPDIFCSSDTPFRGDGSKYNPEDFFLASLSECHMLWYLHKCADAGVIVVDYTDKPTGIMVEAMVTERGRFIAVTLHPHVVVTEEWMVEKAKALHDVANEMCFIANSCNFEVKHEPVARAQ